MTPSESSELPQIHELDAQALDLLVEAGFDPSAIDTMPEHLRDRARRLLSTLGKLDAYPTPPASETLVHATLARIDQEERRQRDRLRLEPAARRRWNIPNVVAVAAVLLVGVGILYPVANEVRSTNSQAMCASGLRSLGSGIAGYSADHGGAMPLTASLVPGAGAVPAADAGVLDNARHLEMLASKGYCDAGCTKCNGARTLSYRVPLHPAQVQLAALPRSPIAGDANPVQPLAQRSGSVINADLRSTNHGQRGQNLLYSDGSTGWTISPVIRIGPSGREDNIWVIRGNDGRHSLDLRNRSEDMWDILLAN